MALNLAQQHESLKIALKSFESFPSWYSIYKSIEACRTCMGESKNEHKFITISKQKKNKTLEVANWYRHASIDLPFPKNPVNYEEAISIAKSALTEVIQHIHTEKAEIYQNTFYTVPKNPFLEWKLEIPQQKYGLYGYAIGIAGRPETLNWAPMIDLTFKVEDLRKLTKTECQALTKIIEPQNLSFDCMSGK